MALLAATLTACDDTPPAVVLDATVDVPIDATVDLTVDCAVTIPADASTQDPTFDAVRGFFLRRCAAGPACHGYGGRGSLALVGPSLYDDLVRHPSAEFASMPRVDPGHPERSFLWLKLTGCYAQLPGCRDPMGPCGQTMPTLSPISEGFMISEAAVLQAWIVAGAPP